MKAMFIISHLILQKIANDLTIISIEQHNQKFYLHSFVLNILRSSSTICLFLLLLNYFYSVFSNPGYVDFNRVLSNRRKVPLTRSLKTKKSRVLLKNFNYTQSIVSCATTIGSLLAPITAKNARGAF